MDTQQWYGESIVRLQESIFVLDDCNEMLNDATRDHERLKAILSVQKHFDLKADQNEAMDSKILGEFVEPDISAKLDRIEALIASLQQTRDALAESVAEKREQVRQLVLANLGNATSLPGSKEELEHLEKLIKKLENK